MKPLNESFLRKLIKEELGIHMEVVEVSNKIYNDIIEDMKQKDSKYNDICYTKEGSVDCSLNNITFKVHYTCRNFLDSKIIEDLDIDSLTEGGTVFFSRKWLWISVNIIALNGTVNKQETLNTLQHELEHIYQQIRSGKRISDNNEQYLKMKTDMECDDEARRKVGRLVYLCYKSEQEGFINGTYAWCMTDDAKSAPYQYKEIKNSPAGKMYTEMQGLYDKVFNDVQMKHIIENEYQYSKEYIEKKLNEFLRKLGRVLIKVNMDKSKFWR